MSAVSLSVVRSRRVLVAALALVLAAVAVVWTAPLFTAVDAVACGVGGSIGIGHLCYPFVQRALIAGLAVGLAAPLVGTFLVYRQMALIGDALAHTSFAGVAIGLFVGSSTAIPISPYIAALVVAVLAALFIEALTARFGEAGDVSMAIVLTGGFALGTVVISLTDGGLSVGIKEYLFGSLTTITRTNASLMLALSGVVVATVVLFGRQLAAVTIDATAARVAGIDVRTYNRLLVVLTAVVVVAAMQILGVILVAALLVIPVATARPIARGFDHALWLSIGAAQFAVVAGITVAIVAGTAVGGTIVLLGIAGYGIVVAFQRRRAARVVTPTT